MRHRADPKQIKQAVYSEIADELSGTMPKTPGHPGDHIFVDWVCDDAIVLTTAVIKNEHLQALFNIVKERAAQVGIELVDD